MSAPWRIDVPSVPPHVTALRDRLDVVWLRERAGGFEDWVRVDEVEPGLGARSVAELLFEFGPLVEYPDPRKATT